MVLVAEADPEDKLSYLWLGTVLLLDMPVIDLLENWQGPIMLCFGLFKGWSGLVIYLDSFGTYWSMSKVLIQYPTNQQLIKYFPRLLMGRNGDGSVQVIDKTTLGEMTLDLFSHSMVRLY